MTILAKTTHVHLRGLREWSKPGEGECWGGGV